jgi:hypothetical protein
MRFYTKQHKFYCGIDLHARTMYLYILNQGKDVRFHRAMQAIPGPTVRTTCPRSGTRLPIRRTATAVPRGSPSPPCRRASKSTGR